MAAFASSSSEYVRSVVGTGDIVGCTGVTGTVCAAGVVCTGVAGAGCATGVTGADCTGVAGAGCATGVTGTFCLCVADYFPL